MDKCSTDVAMLILDYACTGDLGSTARRLGLVSKYFRSIAEPLEFRTLVIAGPDQLSRVLAKLERLKEARLSGSVIGGARANIQHLFICDLKMEHALALYGDPTMTERHFLFEFWYTRDGAEAIPYYNDHTHNFWGSSSALVRRAGETLITITALQWIPLEKESPLDIFSGAHLPRLKALTLKETSGSTSLKPEAGGNPFVPPTAPSLRRLHIIGVVVETVWTSRSTPPVLVRIHPLLENMHSRCGALTHLIIGDWSPMDNVETLVKVIHGSASDTAYSLVPESVTNRQLSGKMVSAVLQLVRRPLLGCGDGLRAYETKTRDLINDVEALGIDGLEVHFPAPAYPEEGNKEFKLLLAEWKSRALD